MKSFKQYVIEQNYAGNTASNNQNKLNNTPPKRTPEQEKAIREWEERYGIGAKNRPEGKIPPRPFDPEEPKPKPIG